MNDIYATSEFIENIMSSSDGEKQYNEIVNQLKVITDSTKKISYKKGFFGTLLTTITNKEEKKQQVSEITSLITSVRNKTISYTYQHKTLLKEVSKLLVENKETISLIKDVLEENEAKKASILDEDSYELVEINFTISENQSKLLSCIGFDANLKVCKDIVGNLCKSFNMILDNSIPAIMNTLLTAGISSKAEESIRFNDSVNEVNNSSMVALSDNLLSLTSQSHNLLEKSSITKDTMDKITANLEKTDVENNRFRDTIKDTLETNISNAARTIVKIESFNKGNKS